MISVVMDLATYEDLPKRGEDIIWFVEQSYERIFQRLPRRPDKAILYGSPVGKISNRQFIFNEKNWARFRQDLLEGKLGVFSLELWFTRSDDPSATPYGAGVSMYSFLPGYPGRASLLTVGVEKPLYEEQPLDMWQEEWVTLACRAFVRFKGATGYLTVDATTWRDSHISPYEGVAHINYLEVHRELHVRVRGYYWGNLLSRGHLERLGGLDAVMREAPCCLVRDLSDREEWRAYLQLTPSIEDTPQEALRALRDYLQPLLPEGRPLRWDPRYDLPHRLVYDEYA